MTRPAVRTLAPTLTVLPGGKRLVTRPLDEAEEAWVEVQAVALEAARFASRVHDLARRIEERPSLAPTFAHELVELAPVAYARSKRAHILAQGELDDLRGPRPVPA